MTFLFHLFVDKLSYIRTEVVSPDVMIYKSLSGTMTDKRTSDVCYTMYL